MSEFKPGDIVRLKSGGPQMTVESIDKKDGGLLCLWFDEGQLEDAVFESVALVPTTVPQQPTLPPQGQTETPPA